VVGVQRGGELLFRGAYGLASLEMAVPLTPCSRFRIASVSKQFTVTAAYAGGAGTIQISPAIVTSGARQNVSASPTNGGAVVKLGGAGTVYRPSLAFYKDAFTFATADLELPKGTDMAARAVMDGISMRMIRDFDSVNARWITRLDVLYGYVAQRPELACRILSN
jgi:hypothetical protein